MDSYMTKFISMSRR